MKIEPGQIRGFRLGSHHLDQKLPRSGLVQAVGACGVQNSPPGAWETALFHRLEGCALEELHRALYEEKTLVQAWSFRGAPVVFPAGQCPVFLTPLLAREGEEPWIYTMGIAAALDWLHMSFDELLRHTRQACRYLEGHIVQSKEALDQILAGLILPCLPEDKRELWQAPSMYGSPDKQTVGGAAVSFLLRPCSFSGLVVFGRRQGTSPTFTSYQNWMGRAPAQAPDGDRELARRFLHCYGPATVDSLMGWLGCSRQQARRLWRAVEAETEPVTVAGRTRYILSADAGALRRAEEGSRMLLLGAHDPYLDLRDRAVILESVPRQRMVWKTVANSGAILKGGRVVGTWRAKLQKDKLAIAATPFEPLSPQEKKALQEQAEAYAAFRQAALKRYQMEE